MNYLGAIFDLDGVLVDTAKYHYEAWKKLANQLQIPFTEVDNERLKGISREQSLELLLAFGNQPYSQAEKDIFIQEKNQNYLSLIQNMTAAEVLPGVKESLALLKSKGVGIALGSASKNAKMILKVTDLSKYFDVIVDGNDVIAAKPDPSVFLLAAKRLGLSAEKCVVFEDAYAGTLAAKAAAMYCVGVGRRINLPDADEVINDFTELNLNLLF